MRNDTDLSNLFFHFQYKMNSSNFSEPPEKYLNHYELEIWLGNEEGFPKELVGKGDLYNILIGAAFDDDADIFDVFDLNAGLIDFGNTIYDFEDLGFKECISDYYNDEIYNPNVFFINRIELLPPFRGHGLGKKVIQDICHRFSGGCGLFALKSFPLQMKRKTIAYPDEWDKKMKFHQLEQDMEKATYKMYSYYQSLGFVNILKNDFFFLRPNFDRIY